MLLATLTNSRATFIYSRARDWRWFPIGWPSSCHVTTKRALWTKKKTIFERPKKPWKKDSTRCLHLSTRVTGYLKLLYFRQATVIANRVGYAVFFFYLSVSFLMLRHQYIDVNSAVDNVRPTQALLRGTLCSGGHLQQTAFNASIGRWEI